MISTLEGTCYTVLVTNKEVCDFASSWPCNRLDTDAEYQFQFDARNGDLIDICALRDGVTESRISKDEDGEWLAALSEDATLIGAEQLGLADVVAIRFGNLAPAAF